MNRKINDAGRFGRVAVLMGGASAERNVSLKSGSAVLESLIRQGIDAHGIDVGSNTVSCLLDQGFDRVFNMIHGRGGEDGVLQGVLESMAIPYTGSGVLASALSMNKLKTKMVWRGAGLPTPECLEIRSEPDLARVEAALGFPVMIKPSDEGSSIGMSRANDARELREAWLGASLYNCTVFAERWITGQEYTVAVLDGEPLPAIRLETPNRFYDFEAKYHSDTTQYHCPCGLDAEGEGKLGALALAACEAVGVAGWARVDVMADGTGALWLIEVNTVPGMTDHSLVPMAASHAGMTFDELVWRILETSLDRK